MVQFAFDSTQHEALADRTFVPEGWYIGMVVGSTMKQTKAKDGYFLEAEIKIVDGIHKDASITERFNINNKNETAQKIGCGQLKALCEAVGVPVISDTTQLHAKPFRIKVKVEQPSQPGYEPSNSIAAIKPLSYEPPAMPATPTAAPMAAPFVPPVAAAPVAPVVAPAPAPVAPAPSVAPAPVAPAPVAMDATVAAAPMCDLPPWMQQS